VDFIFFGIVDMVFDATSYDVGSKHIFNTARKI
jgi:hypothetical protein